MILQRGFEDPAAYRGGFVTIGNFDGVHRGHQQIVSVLVGHARDAGVPSVVLTFDPHPAAVLRGTPPPVLSSVEERLARLEEFGVSRVVVQHFDRAFADQTPDVFLERVSSARELVALVMTAESAFGRDRTGMMPRVRALAESIGFRVVEVARVASDNGTLSSTKIRAALSAGRLAETRRMLGRDHAVTGTVVAGDRRGRELGYPTANLAFEHPVALPADGIYAVRAGWGGDDPLAPEREADGAASLGVRPTFGVGARLLEVYLFDLPPDTNLYGQWLRVEFVRRLRGEKKFARADALVAQMDLDVEHARTLAAADV